MQDTMRGVDKNVVVLFADLRGFTAFSEYLNSIDSFSLIESIIETCVGAAVEILSKNGGFVCDIIGDCIMALFNIEEGETSHLHILKAIKSAQEIHDYFLGSAQNEDLGGSNTIKSLEERVNEKRKHELARIENTSSSMNDKDREDLRLNLDKDIKFGFGIGIHTGMVRLGNVVPACHDIEKFNTPYKTRTLEKFTAIGDVVNTTSRIQGKAQSFETLISKEAFGKIEATINRLKKPEVGLAEAVEIAECSPFVAKNISGLIEVYQVKKFVVNTIVLYIKELDAVETEVPSAEKKKNDNVLSNENDNEMENTSKTEPLDEISHVPPTKGIAKDNGFFIALFIVIAIIVVISILTIIAFYG